MYLQYVHGLQLHVSKERGRGNNSFMPGLHFNKLNAAIIGLFFRCLVCANSQLRKDYGKEQADVIMNITGNIVSGQVTGDTAKQLSELFGKIMQDRESLSINSQDTSISRSKQLEAAIPPSRISALSSGEFVGMVADDPDCKIDLKSFHCSIVNEHDALKKEQDGFKDIPVIRKLDNGMVQRNYLQIKQDVQDIIQSEMERVLSDPRLRHLVIKK